VVGREGRRGAEWVRKEKKDERQETGHDAVLSFTTLPRRISPSNRRVIAPSHGLMTKSPNSAKEGREGAQLLSEPPWKLSK
jgi:hypothetical protein